ncbi:MAG TPA: hypothetical protein VFA66_05865 [Gaiellaceae bacterium]|nr:hypothetical protein [Gaiellaceae bacterium]
MTIRHRDAFEDVAAALLVAATVLGFAATHERWDVWLIGDSRRWTAGLLTVLAAAVLALAARHIGRTPLVAFAIVALVLAAVSFWTASLTPLSLLAATIVLVWVLAVARDLLHLPRRPLTTQ